MGMFDDKKNKKVKRKKNGAFSGMKISNAFSNSWLENAFSNKSSSGNETVQAKLEISGPGDIHEQQADEIARKVVSGEHAGMEVTAASNTVMAQGEGHGLHAGDDLQNELASTKGQGDELDDATREEMESSMGADLGDVRVHTDGKANVMSERINAKAFTHEQDIYFKDGNYDPDSTKGKELLAHELVHTQQQDGKGYRKIMRLPEVDDPAKKQGFIKIDPSVRTMVNAPASLRVSDNDTAMEETVVYQWEEVVVEWKSYKWWAYCTVGNDKGYLRFDQLVSSLVSFGMNEVIVKPSVFQGDLTAVAKEINAALNSTTLWIPDVDEERLVKALPPDLSADQMQELCNIYAGLYGKDLVDELYEGTEPGVFGEGEYLYKSLSRITPFRTNAEGVSIRSENGNKVSAGATVKYIFEAPRPTKELVTGSSGTYETWRVSPRVFTPRVLYWLVSKPDSDVDSRRMHDATEYEFSFDADDEGYYSVMAVILDGNNNKLVLRDNIEVVSQEEMAQETFQANQGISIDAFYALYAELAIKRGMLSTQVIENKDSGITANRNPAYFNDYTSLYDNLQVYYQLKKTDKDEKYVWYVIPEDPKMLRGDTYYFELNQRSKLVIATMKDGTEVFSTMPIDQPSRSQATITLFFPTASNLPDSIRYTIICERYRDDKITGVEKYVQFFKRKDSEEEQERRAQDREVSGAMAKMVEAQNKIEGKVLPINAVYVSEDTGRSLPLQVFYGRSKKQDNKEKIAYTIVDLTKNAETVYYEDETLLDALQEFAGWQSYPDGMIKLELEGNIYTIKTTGGSLLHTFGSWSGFLSTLSFIGGVVASLIPGAQGLAPVLFAAAFTYGAAAAVIGITDNWLKDVPNEKEVALDVMMLATSFLGLGASGLRALGKAREVASLITASRYLFYTIAVGDVIQGVIMLKEVADQVDSILQDKSISDSERLLKLAQVIGSFVASMAMIVFTATDRTSIKNSLRNKRVPEDIIAKLEETPEDMMLVDTLGEKEIRRGLKRKDGDLVEHARQVRKRKLQVQEQLELDKAWMRHGIKDRMIADRLGINIDDLVIPQGSNGKVLKPAARRDNPAKEIGLANKVMDFINTPEETFVLTLVEEQDGIDGFYRKTGRPIQLKSIQAETPNAQADKVVANANAAYEKGVKNGWRDIDLHIEAPDASPEEVINRWNSTNRVPSVNIVDDGTITRIIVHFKDHQPIELPIN